MADFSNGDSPERRAHLLRDARRRLAQLEIETHRLRAELARLEAQGEDEAAARLTEQLAREESRLAHDRRLLDTSDPLVVPSDPCQSALPQLSNDSFAAVDDAGAELTSPWPEEPAQSKAPSRRRKKQRRSRRAWAVSLAAHALFAALLGGLTFGLPLDKTRFLLANAVDGADEFDDFVEISVEPLDVDAPLDVLAEPLVSPTPEAIELASFESPLQAQPQDSLAPTPGVLDVLPADIAGLMTDGAPSGASGASGGGRRNARAEEPSGSAQFFGARSRGDRFVFVVDNSGSMTGGRLETTIFELLGSIGRMSPKQEFHVLFYSDQVYPMFFPEPVQELVPATRDNRARLQQWLGTVQMCKGDCLADALDYAASLEPHVVYLLSDGGYLFTGQGARRKKSRKLAYLTEETSHWPFVVHTLGMTVRDAGAAEGLTLIARAHRGAFTPVGVLPAAAQLAKQKRIPYNRTPGLVWGTNVR